MNYFFLNSRDEFLRIDFSKIVYFEADGNYTNIVTVNKLRGLVCVNLAQMERILADRLKERSCRYVRIGKRYIVNMDFVYQINILKQRLVLSDCASFAFQLEISKGALKKLRGLFITVNKK